MLGLAAPTPLARKAVDVLAQTPADILTVLLLLGYIGMVIESTSPMHLQLPVNTNVDLIQVGQRWRVLRVPMAWDLNRVHVWAAVALVREELGWEGLNELGTGHPSQPSPQTQTHMQTVHKLLGLPTASIWHLVALDREHNHNHSPVKQTPTHLYDDQMTGLDVTSGLQSGNNRETWVPLDGQIWEVACRMEMIGQRVYGLAEVGRVVGSIGLGVEVATGQDVNMKGIGSATRVEEKESPFIFRDPDFGVKVKMPSEQERAGGKRKREMRATSDDTSMRMRIGRSRSEVEAGQAGKGQLQVEVKEYPGAVGSSGTSTSEMQGDSQVVDDCELFLQAAVEVSEHELGIDPDL